MGSKKRRELELSKKKAKRNRLMIISAVIVAIIGVGIYFAVSGDDGPTLTSPPTSTTPPTPPSGPIEAVWIEPAVAGDTVSIPVSEVENNWNIHFRLPTQGDDINFMASIVDGEIYVRANACPPCGSIGFALQDDILVCDTCRTTFEAKTGDGIEGACVDYPKASVPYEITDGIIVMSEADLIVAYQDTLNPGWP